ncbi:MAG: hypothetical protein D6738_08595 [Acidobacteria bacterium]|nr:MAG: hypothetical protein D6738_08595 [Acidobacteriota bacterium]
MARTVVCKDCGKEVPRRAPTQLYCTECSERRDLARKRMWARVNPPSAKRSHARKRRAKRRREMAREAGVVRSVRSRRSIAWIDSFSAPDLIWIVRVAVPFTYAASKNHIYTKRRHETTAGARGPAARGRRYAWAHCGAPAPCAGQSSGRAGQALDRHAGPETGPPGRRGQRRRPGLRCDRGRDGARRPVVLPATARLGGCEGRSEALRRHRPDLGKGLPGLFALRTHQAVGCVQSQPYQQAGSHAHLSGVPARGPPSHQARGRPMMELRPYQREAVEAVYEHLRARDDNPCVVIPTAGGKTPVIATICRDAVSVWGGRVLVLAHVKELLEQAAEKLAAVAPDLDAGVYSAGLGRRDVDHPVVIAGIQSVYRRARALGRFDLVLIDEAHTIPLEGDGMYRQFLAAAREANPDLRVIGLTATPFRMKSGPICVPPPEGVLNAICFEIGVRELIIQGYLSPLRTRAGSVKADTSGLHVRAGEYVAGEVEDLMDDEALVHAACAEIVELTRDRRSVLIFASGVRHGEHVVRVLRERHGIECGFVEGGTPARQRHELLERFRAGGLKYLANVNVLTTGFDAPAIDCVALLRPTLSPGLFYQMVGRGFRLAPGKSDCLVLDYGGNVLRHGPVDAIQLRDRAAGDGEAPAKECPECRALIAAGYAACPECGYEFPPRRKTNHEATATGAGILSGQVERTEHEVEDVCFFVHEKRGAPPDAPRSMRVEYRIGFGRWVSEWVCFEHSGYARAKAEEWWRARSNEPVPDDAEEAVELAEAGALAPTLAITVERRAGEQYDRVVGYVLGEKPPRLEDPDACPEYAHADPGIDAEEIPF